MKARISDVAELARVSTATVSHVINDSKFVSPGLAARVREALASLDYLPNSAARSLRTFQSHAVGFVAPMLLSDTSNFFFMTVAHGVQEVLRQAGFTMVLANSIESVQAEQEELRTFASLLVDGIIIAPVSPSSLVTAGLTHECPVVCVDRRLKNATCDAVVADDHAGVLQGVERLIQAGHTRIGYISGPLGVSTSDDRLSGYKQALAQHGIAEQASLIKRCHEGATTFESGWALAQELLAQNERISAMVVANNILTMGAFGYLQHAGIRVPSEMAIIGFDDYDWTRVTNPPLTVIRQPALEMGRTAASVLLSQIEQAKSSPQEYVLPTELILRGSA